MERYLDAKRKKIIGISGKLHNGAGGGVVRYLNSSLNVLVIKPRRMRWTRHMIQAREKRKTYRISVGKTEGKIALERGRRRIALKLV